ncbi:MAG TPA: DUF1722 domain-containing protein [Candidatus Uhrbacteria bacterium]|nr:DUF1722 domain-containing protein [Candidatus Uhrbacteria bacterium]
MNWSENRTLPKKLTQAERRKNKNMLQMMQKRLKNARTEDEKKHYAQEIEKYRKKLTA